jgi:hypothetical protein
MSIRLNGQFLLVGAIGAILSLLLIFLLPGPDGLSGPESIATCVVAILSGLFLLVGLPALYRTQAKQIGILGLVGVVLLCVGMVLVLLVLSFVQILDVAVPGSIPHAGGDGPPPLALIPAIVGQVLILVGGVIVGITTIRAHIFASAIGWVMTITSVLVLLTAPLTPNNTGVLGMIIADSARALVFASLAWAGATLSFRGNATQVSESSVQRN